MQCPNCCAPLRSNTCEYCGSTFIAKEPKPQVVYVERAPKDQAGMPYDPQDAYVSDKSRTVALILCVLLGYFGAHRFYAGRIALGIAYLLTAGLLGIGWLVDIVLIALGRMADSQGRKISRW